MKSTLRNYLVFAGAVGPFAVGFGAVIPASAQFDVIVNVDEVKPAAAPVDKADAKDGKDGKQGDTPAPAAVTPKPAADEKPKQPENDKPKPAADRAAKQAKAVPRPRPVPQANVAFFINGGVVNGQALEPQIRARLEPILKTELSFANRAAGLNDLERRALVTAGKKWLDDFVPDFAKHMDANQRNMWLQGMRVINGQAGDDPRESVQQGVAELVAATLPPDKVVAYETEAGKRSAFYREVTIKNLVDMIDAKLILSPDQRQKVTASLTNHWDPSWAPQLEMFALNNDMWPNIPDQWVAPELTDSQRSMLSAVNRVSGQMIVGNGVFGIEVGEIDDINLDDVPPPAEDAKKD